MFQVSIFGSQDNVDGNLEPGYACEGPSEMLDLFALSESRAGQASESGSCRGRTCERRFSCRLRIAYAGKSGPSFKNHRVGETLHWMPLPVYRQHLAPAYRSRANRSVAFRRRFLGCLEQSLQPEEPLLKQLVA